MAIRSMVEGAAIPSNGLFLSMQLRLEILRNTKIYVVQYKKIIPFCAG